MTARDPVLVAPLRIEARALRRGGPVVRSGMGPKRASRVALPPGTGPVVVAGFGGALTDELAPGDVVVGSEVIGPDGERVRCALAEELSGALSARVVPILSLTRIARGRERVGGGVADMESFWIARAAGERPFGAVRVIVDTPARDLLNPVATLVGGLRAYRSLSEVAHLLAIWRSRYVRSNDYVNEEPCPSQLGKARASART